MRMTIKIGLTSAMAANALVQTRVDADLKGRASAVLNTLGLSVSDAVRMLLTGVANEGALPIGLATDPDSHDAWFRAKVREALDDLAPAAGKDVEEHFSKRRAVALSPASERRG